MTPHPENVLTLNNAKQTSKITVKSNLKDYIA
jgi:hypothetical protein